MLLKDLDLLNTTIVYTCLAIWESLLESTEKPDFLFEIHGFRVSVPVRKLHACCYDMQIFRAKQAVLVVAFKAKAVDNRF